MERHSQTGKSQTGDWPYAIIYTLSGNIVLSGKQDTHDIFLLYRYSYKLHSKTHEGEKCYKCDLCPYASISARHLESHMLIHTDQKPYQCDHCFQSFRQKQLLKRHCNLYHNPSYVPPPPQEKTHQCPECERPFRYGMFAACTNAPTEWKRKRQKYILSLSFRHKGNLIRHMAVHDPESSLQEKQQALKMGRQKKIQIIDGQRVEVMTGQYSSRQVAIVWKYSEQCNL